MVLLVASKLYWLKDMDMFALPPLFRSNQGFPFRWVALACFGFVHSAKAAEPHRENAPRVWSTSARHEDHYIESNLRDQFAALFSNMSSDAQAGYRNLLENAYLPADFDQEVLARIDQQPFRTPLTDVHVSAGTQAATWARFGLSPRPEDPSRPLQYVLTERGEFVMNCFACHGGNLFGATYPGAPNTLYSLQSLTEQVRRAKLAMRKPLGHMELGSAFIPLGSSVGTSNAVMFGVALMNFRDAELNVHPLRMPAAMVDHDMDAPPWWHFHRKHHIYADGFAQKGHRGLMQFMLVRENGPKQFQAWEDDFRQVYAFLSELRPPQYPLAIDSTLASRGHSLFVEQCSRCHGTYRNSRSQANESTEYPELIIPWEEIRTDPVRLQALTIKHRDAYGKSWFANFGEQETLTDVKGYVAPPLDGIWATAPYLHNGSVPTLWHLMHPEQRPTVWKRSRLGMDLARGGLAIEEFSEVPQRISGEESRHYFDTRRKGKSSQGHDLFQDLSDQEKTAVLEYLKTL